MNKCKRLFLWAASDKMWLPDECSYFREKYCFLHESSYKTTTQVSSRFCIQTWDLNRVLSVVQVRRGTLSLSGQAFAPSPASSPETRMRQIQDINPLHVKRVCAFLKLRYLTFIYTLSDGFGASVSILCYLKKWNAFNLINLISPPHCHYLLWTWSSAHYKNYVSWFSEGLCLKHVSAASCKSLWSKCDVKRECKRAVCYQTGFCFLLACIISCCCFNRTSSRLIQPPVNTHTHTCAVRENTSHNMLNITRVPVRACAPHRHCWGQWRHKPSLCSASAPLKQRAPPPPLLNQPNITQQWRQHGQQGWTGDVCSDVITHFSGSLFFSWDPGEWQWKLCDWNRGTHTLVYSLSVSCCSLLFTVWFVIICYEVPSSFLCPLWAHSHPDLR